MRFDPTGAAPGGGSGDSASATLTGRLTIQGVSRDMELPALVRLHGKMLGMLKIPEDIEVQCPVEWTFRPETP
jgi:hypothetical protein